MKIKDERLDFEARVEKIFEKDKSLTEEVNVMKDKLNGKDQAI